MKQPNVVEQTGIGLAVLLDGFFALGKIYQNIGFYIVAKPAVNAEKFLAMQYQLLINSIEEALGVAEVVNSVENIGFACSIGPGDAIQSASELNKPFCVVFVVEELKPKQLHVAKVNLCHRSLPHKLSQLKALILVRIVAIFPYIEP